MPVLLGSGADAVSIASPDGFDALYRYDTAALKTGDKLFGPDGYDIDDVAVDQITGKVLGIDYTSDRARTHWIDPALAKIVTDLDTATGNNARTLSLSRNNQRMLVMVAGSSQPGSYYFNDATAGGAMHRIGDVDPALRGQPTYAVQMIRYKATDGASIEAVLTLRNWRDPKELPFILMPHGGPRSRFTRLRPVGAVPRESRLCGGQPKYRGSSAYGAKLAEGGEGQWRSVIQDNLNDAVDHLAKQGIANPARVCIVDGSYGRYAAMRGAERDGKRFRCAASCAGVSDISAMTRYDSQFLNGDSTVRFFKKQAPDLSAVSPINDPHGFSTLLIVHGKRDHRVSVSQSRRWPRVCGPRASRSDITSNPKGTFIHAPRPTGCKFSRCLRRFSPSTIPYDRSNRN